NFILPGGSKGAANFHLARTVCRRAEREVVSLSKNEEINSEVEIYLNRLSDLLFVLARYQNLISGTADINWQK
ncbi:MAG: ATP:cob(I)alamin adenosyltransferase, partial [Ignavibacteria bacterium]|nr:ATP:cob(I)alamin adenosyltransferase [Ignavibacteria bacterium]